MIAQQDTSLNAVNASSLGKRPLPPVSPAPQPSLGYQAVNAPMVNAQAPSRLTPSATSTAPSAAPPASIPMPSQVQPTSGSVNPATATPAGIPSIQPFDGPMANSSAPNMSYGTTSTFGPGKDLQSTQIQPGAESNRFDLARQALDTYSKSELPQFRASVRNEVGNQAALGRTGSGMLNTSLGNLDLAEQDKYNTMAQQLLNGALGNQISDNANQRAELRGERDYQTGQSNNAFNQGVTQTELGDQLTNSAFGRSQAQEQAGEANNPANTQLILSSIFGGQANAANGALGGLIGNTVNRNAQANSGMDADALLRAIFGGNPNAGNVPTVPQSVPDYSVPGVVS